MDHLSSTIIMCTILLLFYASGTVKGANIDDDCTHDDNCTDTNTVCSSDSCACSMSTFLNTTDACVNKVALEGGCADGQPPEQCDDSLAECRNDTGFKCLCKPDNYKSGSVCKAEVDINATCDIADMATDQCSVPNTACSDDGTGMNKCLCTSDYYKLGSMCHDKVALEGGCADGQPPEQCDDSLAECRNDTGFKCLCKPDNYKSGSVCKAEVDINATCDIADMATDQCSVPNTACSDDGTGMNKCLCTSDYYKLGSMCHDRKKPDEVCESDQCVANAMCSGTNDTCVCNTGYKATPTSTPTSCESSDATIIIAHIYVFIFGIVASFYLLV